MCGMTKLLDVGNVSKDRQNEYHGYSYASESQVTARFRDAMKAGGLHVSSVEIVSHEQTEIQGRNGALTLVTVKLRMQFADDTGKAYGPFEAIGQGADSGDKAGAKAMAMARKYCISMAGLISWDDDPEGDTRTDLATQNRPKKNGKPKASEPTFVPDKPDQADLFMSLLEQKAKVSSEALERAWAFDTHDPDVAKSCRWYAASLENGKWWSNLKEKAAKADLTNGRVSV